MSTHRTITAQELGKRKQHENVVIIDVRTPVEYREVHVEGAQNVPLESLNPEKLLEERKGEEQAPLFVICQSGNRSTKACEKLVNAGHTNIVNVEGGTNSWVESSLPVVRGKKTISLERQVRIAAGFLALLGAVLGFLVHPYYIGLSAFVGAGLMFAGITNTCGMAMLIARMPWNQSKEGTCRA